MKKTVLTIIAGIAGLAFVLFVIVPAAVITFIMLCKWTETLLVWLGMYPF